MGASSLEIILYISNDTDPKKVLDHIKNKIFYKYFIPSHIEYRYKSNNNEQQKTIGLDNPIEISPKSSLFILRDSIVCYNAQRTDFDASRLINDVLMLDKLDTFSFYFRGAVKRYVFDQNKICECFYYGQLVDLDKIKKALLNNFNIQFDYDAFTADTPFSLTIGFFSDDWCGCQEWATSNDQNNKDNIDTQGNETTKRNMQSFVKVVKELIEYFNSEIKWIDLSADKGQAMIIGPYISALLHQIPKCPTSDYDIQWKQYYKNMNMKLPEL